ncbi:MAG: GTPase Era [Deltaproteobacteria bacterium]|nr:GTPase Era [Deltaproteobacteria bacterium]
MTAFRCGYVALLGRPNVGKSTLINRLIDAPLSIVTAKPQTTRQRIVGCLQRPNAQLIVVDTPGFHASTKLLNRSMLTEIRQAVSDADVACLLIEARGPVTDIDRQLWTEIQGRPHRLLVANKMDLLPPDRIRASQRKWREAFGAEPILLSAMHGTGVGEFVEVCLPHIPEGEPLYPQDEYTEHSVRFLAAEAIREQAIVALSEELPYAIAVEIVEFKERPDLARITANLVVEKASQKGIVIGQGGRMIKRIGQRAREKIEALVGTQVYLELRVRVEEGWTKDPAALRRLGYKSP